MALTKIDDRGLKTPIDLLDNEKIRFGTGNDLEIYHDGSNSVIKNTTGDLIIEDTGGNLIFRPKTGEDAIKAYADGAVELYHANSKKLETASVGVRWHGTLYGIDDQELHFGNGSDLKIYHDGTNSFLVNTTGDLLVRNTTGNEIKIQAVSGEQSIQCIGDGAVELYWDGNKKFETTSTGTKVTGDFTVDYAGTATLGGSSLLLKRSTGNTNYINAPLADADLVISADENLLFHTVHTADFNSTERMRIDSSGKVYIGATSSHAGKFIVKDTDNSGNQIWVIGRANDNTGSISFRNNGDAAYTGRIQCGDTNGMEFNSAGSTRASLDTSGNFIINDGNLKILTAGHGIDFSVTSDATGKTSELLDDYEEGTFTPVITGATHSDLGSYGRYVRVGKLVTISVRIQISASAVSGGVTVTGLPFTPITGTGENYTSGGITYYDMPSSITNFDPYIASGNSTIYFFEKGSGTQLTFSSTFTAKYLGFSAMYYV